MTAAGSPLVAGARWLTGKRVTLGVAALLVAVFAVQTLVRTQLGPRAWTYLFLAHTEPTPGWLLAPFSHRGLAHLAGSLSVLVVYGGLLEDTLSAAAYLAFYTLAGYLGTLAQLLAYLEGAPGLGTLGASGAVLGLAALFGTIAICRYHARPATLAATDRLFALTAAVIVALVVFTDLLSGGPSSLPGHLGAGVAGAGYGLLRGADSETAGRVEAP